MIKTEVATLTLVYWYGAQPHEAIFTMPLVSHIEHRYLMIAAIILCAVPSK
jgi:hypothetical protein